MTRREFVKTTGTTAAVLAAQGYLPLLGADKRKRRQRGGSANWFTEPSSIEPITGYTEKFSPVSSGSMAEAFKAHYTLIHWNSAGAKSNNSERGSLQVSWNSGQLKTIETRDNRPSNIVTTSTKCTGKWNTASAWKLVSSFSGGQNGFQENGVWDGSKITVKSKSWTQQTAVSNPLTARWALLPLLASGELKKAPLCFDMLDDSTLRSNQTLRYESEIEIPVKAGVVKLHSYLQTGDGILPTHYLVDAQGRVQLITMSMVNWALTDLQGKA